MAARTSLTIETFLAVSEMVAGHLRLKDADRWSPHVCKLKFHSFASAYPEVNEMQFMWAAEQWIQSTNPATFHRFPVWSELMAPLYRTEGGMANRSWGFRSDLPDFLKPSADQLAKLPVQRTSILSAPDIQNPAAYVTVGRAGEAEAQGLALAPVAPPVLLPAAPSLTDEEWSAYLASLEEE